MLSKSYCVQGRKGRWPNRSCIDCALRNYGLDCHNNPVPTQPAPKRLVGWEQAMATYHAGGGFCGDATVSAILADVGPELETRLTGHELGLVLLAVARAYHKGRDSNGGVDLCDDCLWLPWGGGQAEDDAQRERGQLVPIAALREIRVSEDHESTRYQLDYTEPW